MKARMWGVLVAVGCFSALEGEALAWGEATHAYLADHLGKTGGVANADEIYGAMAPDAFNSSFDLLAEPDIAACVRGLTHGYPLTGADEFMSVWQSAANAREKSTAFGYVTHNDLWGADYLAHWATLSGDTPGYLVAKAYALESAIAAVKDATGRSAWDYLGIPPNPNPGPDPFADPALQVSDFVVQLAGEVMIKRRDPNIGAKMALATLQHSTDFEASLESSLTTCGLSPGSVADTESGYRTQLLLFAQALRGSETQLMAFLASSLSLEAPAYLAAVTGKPFDPLLLPLVRSLVKSALAQALTSVEGDYLAEIDALVAALPALAAAHGVAY